MTPVATTTALDTTCPREDSRTCRYVASRNTYGKAACPSVRVRNAPTVSSRPAQILDTSDFDIPVPPSAATRSSTERVDTPCT